MSVRSAGWRLAKHLAHNSDELLRIKRLDQPARCPGRPTLRFHGVGGLGSEHQNRGLCVLRHRPQGLDQAQTIHAWHVLVGQDQIDCMGIRLLQPILPIDCIENFVAGAFQGKRHHLPDGGRIVDRKNDFGPYLLSFYSSGQTLHYPSIRPFIQSCHQN